MSMATKPKRYLSQKRNTSYIHLGQKRAIMKIMAATLGQTREFQSFFLNHGKSAHFKKGDFIIRPGDTPAGVFFIKTGLVKAYDITRYHEENMLIVRKNGEIFPLIWAITGQERHIVYEALSETQTYQVSRKQFERYSHEHPAAMAVLLDMTVEMYRLHSERILNLEYRGVRERIISFLLTMGQRFGEQTENGLTITVPLRHQDIASSINASRETTSRQLGLLEHKKLITTERSLITLVNTEKLHSYL